jgi:hypothetical protein
MAGDLSRDPQLLQAVGYFLEPYDGGLNPFRHWGDDPIPGIHCPKCYSPIDHEAVSTSVDVRGNNDAYWADGHVVVSERFRDLFWSLGYDDIAFPCVDAKRRLYELRPTRILQVDIEKSEPLLSGFCVKCGNFDSYIRGRGVFLYDISKPLTDGVYRTDLLVGCRIGKHYDVIVARETRDKLLATKPRRIRFRPLPDFDADFEKRREQGKASATWWRRKERAFERLRRMRARKGLAEAGQATTRLFRS